MTYPNKIVNAFNAYHGKKFTADEMEAENYDYVRDCASMALPFGRVEFDLLMDKEITNK